MEALMKEKRREQLIAIEAKERAYREQLRPAGKDKKDEIRIQ